ncbi:hypothetical protein JCM18237_24820 [Halorubrum luteum]
MEYAYATCILNETGEEINEENLTAVLEAAGCSVIESRIKAIVAALEDVDVSGVTAVDVEDTGNASPVDQEISSTANEDVTTGDTEMTSGIGPATEAEAELVSVERNGETPGADSKATDCDDGRVTDAFDEPTNAEPSDEPTNAEPSEER